MTLLVVSGLAQAQMPETDWLELMPKSDQKALEAMPEIDHNSPEAMGTFDSKGGLKQSKGLPAVMYSTKTVAAMNGKNIRLGGYPGPSKPMPKAIARCSFSCLIRAPASTFRHRHPTRWCWCAIPKA